MGLEASSGLLTAQKAELSFGFSHLARRSRRFIIGR